MNKTDRDASIPRNVQLYVEDDSGQLIALKSDLSGQLAVDITVGDIVAIVSGEITATMTSGEVHILSGQVIAKTSGETITIASGAWGKSGVEVIWRGVQVSGAVIISGTVGINSGLIAILSGLIGISSGTITTSITSGSVQVSGAVIVSGIVGISGSIGVLSGQVSVSSGEVHIISGSIGAQVSGAVIVSGSVSVSGSVVSTLKVGVANILFSGYPTTNVYVYSGTGFLTFDKGLVMIECLSQGSGVQYTIRGQPFSGLLTFSMTSGQLTSGQQVVETISDPYSWVDVGVENTVDNYTGIVTVVVSRK